MLIADTAEEMCDFANFINFYSKHYHY